MAFQAVPNCCSFVTTFGNINTEWTNTLHAYFASWNETMQLLVADSIFDSWDTDMMPEISNAYQLLKVTSYDLRTEDGPVVVTTQTPVTGGKTDPSAAINACMVMTMRTGGRGRSRRGRNYLSGFTEAQAGGQGFASQALATTMEDAYVDLHNLLDGLSVDLVIVQRWLNKQLLATPLLHSITQFEVRNLNFGSQRRRIGRA